MGRLTDHIRASCAQRAAEARSVAIDREVLAAFAPPDGGRIEDPGLDPVRHYLEGAPEDVALYTLALDTINFGSGWFPTLRKRVDPASGRTVSGTSRWRGTWPTTSGSRGRGRSPTCATCGPTGWPRSWARAPTTS